ncbi:unnamed protein product [Caenorhabditis bovis]|uniref:Uncharacterized protein n=1 Tax=Caenorhabditis bovis TaxID=2654633 RepID=A0A8S1EK91_9PELO|nr:unnamed protein product [Caenorhabditis bovis]
MIQLLFLFALVSSVIGRSTVIKYKHQDAYEDFLNLMESFERTEKPKAKPNWAYNSELYGLDRHGKPFMKCVEFNATTSPKTRNVRCSASGDKDRPGCFAMYDFETKQLLQGCYNYQEDIAHFCETSKRCTFSSDAKVGFCCCVGQQCNSQKKIMYNGEPLETVINEKRKKDVTDFLRRF